MLDSDINTRPSKPWSKVQALSRLIQLKSGNSSRSPPTSNSPLVSHSDAVNNSPQQASLESEQPKPDRLKVFVATWNMYGDLPSDLDLEPFLTRRYPSSATPTTNPTSPSESSKVFVEHHTQNVGGSPFLDTTPGHPYHLLALGTQECERAIGESLVYSSKEVWEQRLSDYLGDQYKLLKCETLAALHLAVFVWKPVASFVKNVHSADIKTGWANMVGNKGAVAVSLTFGSQSLLFINCHLRAHQTKLAERNANVQRILHQLQIKGGRPIPHAQSPNGLFHLPSLKKLSRSTKSMKSVVSTKSMQRHSNGKSPKDSNEPPNKKGNKTISPGPKTSTKVKKGQSSSGHNMTKPDTEPSNSVDSTANANTTQTSNQVSAKNDLPTKSSRTTANNGKRSTTSSTRRKQKNHNKKPSATSLSSSSSESSLVSSESIPAEDQHSVTEQFDHVFIFGDTNYRIDAERQFVLDTIKRQDFKTLLKYDQLMVERQKGTTPLACFNEHPIDFIPTYKFDTLESTESSDASSSSLPLSTSPAEIEVISCKTINENNEPAVSSPSSSTPQTPLTDTTESSAASSSNSMLITPKNSLHHAGSICIRYDTSPKQRVPSWTDRILWHDRLQHHHHEQQQRDGSIKGTMTHTAGILPSAPTATSISTTATNPQLQSTNKPKLSLKWITTLKRKSNNSGRGVVNEPIDKSTVCYHYDTVLDPRLIGASDHLPVLGVFGIWFNDWEDGAYRRAKSIRSFKTKVPIWRKWLQ